MAETGFFQREWGKGGWETSAEGEAKRISGREVYYVFNCYLEETS